MADPKIRFDILANAQGAGEVSQLANELEKLDGSLDPALAARAKETADQLREVGRQQEAINTFRQLKAASSDTAAALNQAQAQAQALAREIAASGMPTRNQTGQMEKLRDAVRAAKDAHTESVQKLQQHRQAMADAGVETVNLSAQQAELSTRQKALRTDAGEIAGKYREQAEAAKASASTQAQAVARVADGNDKLGKSAGGATELVKGLASALAAGFTFNELVQAAAQMEAIKAGLQAVTGSADQAGKEFDFVRQVATRVGADVTQVGQAFLGLAAATRGTAVEGEPTRQVFEAVAAAMGKTGKSSSETQNALVALAQMASKGAVSMEELRGQLGEALPGALQAAASGLGITTQDLIKLVEQGKIAAEDLFPALTKGLNELYGSGGQGAQTLAQEITNIKNQFVELANNIGEAGGLDALKTGAEVAQMSLVLLDDTLVRTGKTIGVVAAAIASMDFSGLPAAFEEIEKEGRDKLLKAAAHNETLRKSLQLSSDEAMKSALAQQASGQSVKAAGEEAERAGASYTQLSSAYQKVSDYVKAQIDASEQSRIAREAEGKASVALAQAFGTESEKRGAVAAAAQTDADELMKIALLRQTEADVMRAELAAKQELIDKNNTDSDQRRKEIEELKQKIDATQTAADKAIALAQASQLASAQAKAEADATRDNSGRVVELASAYEEARKKVEALRLAKSAGQDVSEKLRVAEIEAGKAAILYKDALADQLAMINANKAAKAEGMNLQQMAVRVAIEEQKSIVAIARARGDNYTATQAENEIKRLEIQLVQLSAEAKRAEAKSVLAGVEATRAQLVASGQLTPFKRAELDALTAKARAMEKEAEIGEITAKRMKALAEISQQAGSSSAGAAGGFDKLASSIEGVGNAAGSARDRVGQMNRAVELAKRQSHTNGSVTYDQNDALQTLVNKQRAGTLTADDLSVAEAANSAAQANLQMMQQNMAAYSIDGQNSTRAAAMQAQQIVEAIKGMSMGSTGQVTQQAASSTQTTATTSTVVIKLGGETASVSTASQSDADSLTGMLKKLGSYVSRS